MLKSFQEIFLFGASSQFAFVILSFLRSINKYLLVYITILLIEVLVSTTLKLYVESYKNWDIYLGARNDINFSTIVSDVLSFLILFNYIVPISLYVTSGKALFLCLSFCTHFFISSKIAYTRRRKKLVQFYKNYTMSQ